MKKEESVKVVVRCRPMSKKEIEDNRQIAISADPKTRSIEGINPNKQGEKKQFTFDFTYNPESSQEQIFNETALPILNCLMQGYNGTIFAYGQTGTGKTFTMEGSKTDLNERGLVPRTIEWIFDYIKKASGVQFLVQASFIEIYKEEVRDLLAKNVKNKLNVREKESGVFYVEDCNKVKVESPEEMLKLMVKGRENRKTGATLMNPDSSRSHSIFQIIIENSEEIEGEMKYKMGKLNLVDLAGSERQDKTGATGERLDEAAKINLSLSILGNVISALVTGKSGFVPYRESKLTMLLADSLGGNTKTVMIANVGPADYNYDESINTLWYASRAKKIKNKPKINEDPKDALLRSYQEEIENMKKALAGLGKGPMKQITDSSGKIVMVEDHVAMKKMEEQLEQERELFKKQKEQEILNINKQKDLAEEEKQKLIEKIELEKDEFKKNKEDTKKLLEKYKNMKSKVLNGDDAQTKVKNQEEKIKKTKEEIEAIKLEEERLKREYEEKSKPLYELKEKYKSMQAHSEDLNEKINLLRENIERLKKENKESAENIENDLISLGDYNKVLTIENLKKEFIIKHFIPESEKNKLIDCIEYSEKEESYIINKKKAIKNNYKSNKEIINKIKNNQISQLDEGFLKFGNEKSETDGLLNLNFEFVEKLVSDFTPEDNPHYRTEVEHILNDDDSDMNYLDKNLNIWDTNILPYQETGLTKEIVNKCLGVTSEVKPKRVPTATKKK